MKLLRGIKVAALLFASAAIAWGLFYVTASAAECIVVCTKHPIICKVICF